MSVYTGPAQPAAQPVDRCGVTLGFYLLTPCGAPAVETCPAAVAACASSTLWRASRVAGARTAWRRWPRRRTSPRWTRRGPRATAVATAARRRHASTTTGSRGASTVMTPTTPTRAWTRAKTGAVTTRMTSSTAEPDGGVLRVLWVTEHHPPSRGGMAQSSDRITRGLRAAGVTIDVLHLVGGDGAATTRGGLGGSHLMAPMGTDPEHGLACAWLQVRRHLGDGRYTHVVAFGGTWALTAGPVLAAWLDAPLVTLLRGVDFDTGVATRSPRRRRSAPSPTRPHGRSARSSASPRRGSPTRSRRRAGSCCPPTSRARHDRPAQGQEGRDGPAPLPGRISGRRGPARPHGRRPGA